MVKLDYKDKVEGKLKNGNARAAWKGLNAVMGRNQKSSTSVWRPCLSMIWMSFILGLISMTYMTDVILPVRGQELCLWRWGKGMWFQSSSLLTSANPLDQVTSREGYWKSVPLNWVPFSPNYSSCSSTPVLSLRPGKWLPLSQCLK